jgi:hypothetical protein
MQQVERRVDESLPVETRSEQQKHPRRDDDELVPLGTGLQ